MREICDARKTRSTLSLQRPPTYSWVEWITDWIADINIGITLVEFSSFRQNRILKFVKINFASDFRLSLKPNIRIESKMVAHTESDTSSHYSDDNGTILFSILLNCSVSLTESIHSIVHWLGRHWAPDRLSILRSDPSINSWSLFTLLIRSWVRLFKNQTGSAYLFIESWFCVCERQGW